MKISALLSASLFIMLSGCVNDAQIIDTIANDIEATSGLGTHQVRVGSTNGIVTLDGFVPSEANRKEVERVALRAEGVSEVKNRLEVRQSSAAGATGDVCTRVTETLSAQGGRITAKCDGGQVILRGAVTSEDAARKAGRAASGTPGVKSVINLLTSPAPLSDKVLDQRVQRAIETVNEFNVSHYVQNGVVYFTGFVSSREKMDPVISAARMVDGVRDVKNNTQIEGKGNF